MNPGKDQNKNKSQGKENEEIMVVNHKKKKELIARMLNVGSNRVKFEPDKLDDIADSITREDIRSLIKNGLYGHPGQRELLESVLRPN